MHARVSALCGHALPPKRGCVSVRTRLCEPVPHDLVHVDHGCVGGAIILQAYTTTVGKLVTTTQLPWPFTGFQLNAPEFTHTSGCVW